MWNRIDILVGKRKSDLSAQGKDAIELPGGIVVSLLHRGAKEMVYECIVAKVIVWQNSVILLSDIETNN